MPTPNRDHMLTTRHFTTACRCDRFRSAVESTLAADTPQGDIWCWSEEDAGACFRIFGLGLHGEIFIEATPGRKRTSRSEVLVHLREGDLPVLDRLIVALGDELMRPAKRPEGGEALLFDNIAQVMQSFQRNGPAGIVVAESAVESALDCVYGNAPGAIDEIKRLVDIRRAVESGKTGDNDVTETRVGQYLRRWPNAPVALYRGEKIHLVHQLHVPDDHGFLILKVHFAYLPKTREHVIGWVEEELHCPF